MKRSFVSWMGIIFMLFLFSCHPDPGKGTPDYTIQYANIPGVDGNLLSLDIYNEGIPANAPVVIWIHGGGWTTGDKSFGMEFKEQLMKEQNYVLVSINYRLSNGTNGIIHPTHVQDVAKAIAWVYHNIGDYGGDSTKMAVMGHSAGAHLAALVCTDETYLQAEGLDLDIIDGCGSFDVEAYNINYSMNNGNQENELYINAFTNNTAVWENASPVNHIDPGKNIPSEFLLVKRGTEVRRYICDQMRDSLISIGVHTVVIDGSSLNHEQVNDYIGAPGDQVMTSPVISFLQASFN